MAVTTRDLGQRANANQDPQRIEDIAVPNDTVEAGHWGNVPSEWRKTNPKTSVIRAYFDSYLQSITTQSKVQPVLPTHWQDPAPSRRLVIDPTTAFGAWFLSRVSIPDRQLYDSQAVEESLRKIAGLPPNWDSYGAPRIASNVIDEARSILLCVAAMGLPQPWVAPGADGGIGIQWDTKVAELYIDIVPGEPTSYLLTLNVGSSEEDEIDAPLTLMNLTRVLNQFAEAIR